MMLCSFSSSSLAHLSKSSLHSNPTPSRKIKNPKIFLGPSNVHPATTITHLFFDSPLRASVKCFSQGEEKQQLVQEVETEEQVYEFERLFSNLNQATLKREPGSLSSAIFLVAGTTVCSFYSLGHHILVVRDSFNILFQNISPSMMQ